jgi:hypothetical protein
MACTVKDSDTLRFAVGDRVQCRAIPGVRKGDWTHGKVEQVLLSHEARPTPALYLGVVTDCGS